MLLVYIGLIFEIGEKKINLYQPKNFLLIIYYYGQKSDIFTKNIIPELKPYMLSTVYDSKCRRNRL